jgi:glucose-6-phosphate isomerase
MSRGNGYRRMRVDIGNSLAEVATPGVPRASLEDLDEQIADAHDRIQDGMEQDEYGYAALELPEQVDLDQIRAAVDPLSDLDTLLLVGIGGSALGAATLASALGEQGSVRVLDNVDPAELRSILSDLDLSRAGIHVASRSGKTAETLANFLVVRDAYERAGVDWTDQTLVTTGSDGPLRSLAERNDLSVLDAPSGVPGRFSVLSTVGLPAAVFSGVDVEALLSGAASERARLCGSLFDCPAYAYAAACYSLERRGIHVNAIMPYAESLERLAEWFAQLWAESLGKQERGQTPVRAMGATDQHSQLQLYRAGPRTTMVSFIRPRDRPSLPIPAESDDAPSYLRDTGLGELLDAELQATEASLADAGRPSVRVEIETLDAAGVGELLYGFEAATIMVGELADVDTFTQPAVEWGKRATRSLLGSDETETAVAEEKTSLVVE